jgi:hypothetical protein
MRARVPQGVVIALLGALFSVSPILGQCYYPELCAQFCRVCGSDCDWPNDIEAGLEVYATSCSQTAPSQYECSVGAADFWTVRAYFTNAVAAQDPGITGCGFLCTGCGLPCSCNPGERQKTYTSNPYIDDGVYWKGADGETCGDLTPVCTGDGCYVGDLPYQATFTWTADNYGCYTRYVRINGDDSNVFQLEVVP